VELFHNRGVLPINSGLLRVLLAVVYLGPQSGCSDCKCWRYRILERSKWGQRQLSGVNLWINSFFEKSKSVFKLCL